MDGTFLLHQLDVVCVFIDWPKSTVGLIYYAVVSRMLYLLSLPCMGAPPSAFCTPLTLRFSYSLVYIASTAQHVAELIPCPYVVATCTGR